MKKPSKKHIVNLILALLVLSVIILYIRSKIIREVVYIIIFSFIVSYTLKPLLTLLVDKSKLNKKLGSALIIIAVFSFVVIIAVVLIPSLFNESSNIENIMNSIDRLIGYLNSKVNIKGYGILDTLGEQLNEKFNIALKNFSEKAFDSLINFSENLLSLAVVPVVSYYFLSEGELIENKLLLMVPINKRAVIKKILTDIDKALGRYIFSQFILCLIVGVLTFFVLIFFKVQFPVLLSIFNAVINIVPYFGPLIGAIPAIIVALLQSPTKALYTTLFLFLIQQVEGNLLSPQITASSIKMHPLLIIILLLIGEKIGGFFGMILAIPIGVIIKVIYEDIDYHMY
jgi:predicted PurR-regulated permease PerM